jgi:hypothetical protein
MGKRKIIFGYIDEEMPDTYKREAVKEYIGSVLKELSKRQEQDIINNNKKAKRINDQFRSNKQKSKFAE